MADQLLDPVQAFAELGRMKLGETDLAGVLARIATLARRTVPNAEEVSVTLLPDTGPYTAAYTGDLALALDEGQYRDGSGPCLEAAAAGITLWIPDLAREDRWPRYVGRALDDGVRGCLAVGFPVREAVAGALNIYAGKPDAFDDDGVAVARTFSGYAAVALANAHLYDATATLAQHMQAAMVSRAVIEQAKGILMAERRCTADEAFATLSKLSQDSNRKLRDVASALVARAARR